MRESNEKIINNNEISSSKNYSLKKQIKRKDVFLKKDEVEKKLFEAFPILNEESRFHDFFSSYDFHDNEAFMVHFWKDLLEYLILHLNENFCLNYGQLISLTRLKYNTPIGLPNIIKKLLKDGDFMLASELKSDEYYKKHFPALYPRETWGEYFKKTITNSIWGGNDSEKKEIQSDDLVIEKKSFLNHLDILLELMRNHCEESDQSILTINELKELIFENETCIKYLDSNLDLCLLYLAKTKKIEIFETTFDNTTIKCIKLLNHAEDQVNIKDQAMIKLNSQIKVIEKRIVEQELEVKELTDKAKGIMKTGDKEKAKKILNKRLMLKNNLNNLYNIKDVLFEKLLSIKSMEATKNVTNTLEEVLRTCEKLKQDVDALHNLKENYEDIRAQNNEIKDMFIEYSENNPDKGYIDNELNMMYKALEISDNDKEMKNVNYANKANAEAVASNQKRSVHNKTDSSKMNEIDNLLAQLNN